MKKASAILIYTAFGLVAVYATVTLLLTLILGYDIFLTAPLALALPPAVISLAAMILCFIAKEKPSKTAKALSFASVLLYLFFALASVRHTALSACMLLSSFCMMAIFVKYINSKYRGLRFLTVTGYIFLVSALILFWAFLKLISGLAVNEVVKEIVSPNNEYCIELVKSDQGAMGGNTIVQVRENTEINFLFFVAKKSPQRIYTGRYNELYTISVYWKNDNCVVVGDEEYRIDSSSR